MDVTDGKIVILEHDSKVLRDNRLGDGQRGTGLRRYEW